MEPKITTYTVPLDPVVVAGMTRAEARDALPEEVKARLRKAVDAEVRRHIFGGVGDTEE